MAAQVGKYGPGRSPFDSIRQYDDEGKEWWSARELMELLEYKDWPSFVGAIDRAKAAVRCLGYDYSSIFVNRPKNPNGPGRRGLDIGMRREGCYYVVLECDTSRPVVAAAKAYFAMQTRRAELELDPFIAPAPTPTAIPRPWSERFCQTIEPHLRCVNIHHPGCFTVVTTLVGSMLSMEDELIRHMFQLSSSDRPDGSIGIHWSRNRKARGLTPSLLTAPLKLPDQPNEVFPAVYQNDVRGVFEAWFHRKYLPNILPNYYAAKPQFKVHGALPPASAADHTCQRLTGRPARIGTPLRKQLDANGGFVPVCTFRNFAGLMR